MVWMVPYVWAYKSQLVSGIIGGATYTENFPGLTGKDVFGGQNKKWPRFFSISEPLKDQCVHTCNGEGVKQDLTWSIVTSHKFNLKS